MGQHQEQAGWPNTWGDPFFDIEEVGRDGGGLW